MGRYNLAYTIERIENCASVIDKMTDAYKALSGRVLGNNAVAESIVTQFGEISRLMKESTGAFIREVVMPDEDIHQLEKVLEQRGVKICDLKMYERGDGHHELHVRMKSIKNKCPTVREIAAILSANLDADVIAAENNRVMLNGVYNDYVFVESGRFNIMYGVAKRSKGDNIVSGDNYLIDEISHGRFIISIADGMGSGRKAAEESRMTVELIGDALRAGFSPMAAIEMVNTAFSVNDIKGVPITLDMCALDVSLGIADFIKLGAVATYIKRDGWVEIIQSDTLPIGVFGKVDFDHTIKKMYSGDYIIMVSDGVLEALPSLDKEEIFVRIVAELKSRNPKLMAEEILAKVLEISANSSFTIAKDDMTVIVTGMFERTYVSGRT